MLLSHFTVFYFMPCLDISKWKAFLTKLTVCKLLIIDVLNNGKHNAKCLNFYLYMVSCRPKVSGTPGEF